MKKAILISFLFLSIVARAQFSLSIGGGTLFSELKSKSAGIANKKSFIPALGFKYSWKRVSLNTALSYAKVGYNSTSVGATCKCSYKYLVVPLYASYAIPVGRFYIGANLGANVSALIKAQDEQSERTISGANSVIPSLIVGAKAGYNISRRFSFDITGWYNYALSDVNNSIDSRINGIAVLGGMNYKF